MSRLRRDLLSRLSDEVFDLLVIGGGITGTGIARDAALRGLKVLLVEKSDLAIGTSSKSSKLIHGGLRYLQQAELGLVFESVSERTRLLRLAPHLVRPLEFLVPAYRGQFPSRTMLHGGLLLYDALAKFRVPGRHRMFRRDAILEQEPLLRRARLTGGVTYFDATTTDARLTVENALDAQRNGATILTYAKVVGFLTQTDAGQDRIYGVELVDELEPGAPIAARAKVTINATGPWSDLVFRLLSRNQPAPLLRPTKGSHIVLDWEKLPIRRTVVMTAPQDHRVLFAIPWIDPECSAASRTVIGTTDTDYHGSPDRVACDADDATYLLACVQHAFPETSVTKEDILSTWSGLRPLVMPDAKGLSESQISREHRLIHRPGLLAIVGGKLTTYRKMAAEVVEAAYEQLGHVAPPCPTEDRPLPGAQGLPPREQPLDPIDPIRLGLLAMNHPQLDAQVCRHLAQEYGTRALPLVENALRTKPALLRRIEPELPFVYAEIDLAVEEEFALRLDDVLSRRLPLLLLSRDQGLAVAEAVAAHMAPLLGWSTQTQAAEVARYQDTVALSRAFRSSRG